MKDAGSELMKILTKARWHLQGAANKKIVRRFNASGDFLR
jgi:hypothetical protein